LLVHAPDARPFLSVLNHILCLACMPDHTPMLMVLKSIHTPVFVTPKVCIVRKVNVAISNITVASKSFLCNFFTLYSGE